MAIEADWTFFVFFCSKNNPSF